MLNIIGIKNNNNSLEKSSQFLLEKAIETKKSNFFSKIEIKSTGSLIYGAIGEERMTNPFIYSDENNRYSLLYDGEIYNYSDLKNELLAKNIAFPSRDEGEAILKHLIENGEEGISSLRGAFTLVFYDSVENELILALNQIGIRPLLFSFQKGELFFASDLMLFNAFLNEWRMNQVALKNYFRFTYISAPNTIIEGGSKLLHGHYLKLKGKEFDIVEYYVIKQADRRGLSYLEETEELKKLLEDATAQRMGISDTQGAFLSGGVDSSIISAITAKLSPVLYTCSIGFQENAFFDETEYENEVAAHIKSSHYSIQLGKDNIIGELKTVLDTCDEPYADSSSVVMYFLAKSTKNKVDICLSGDGADEIFVGYNKHKAFLMSKNPGFLLKSASKMATLIPRGTRRGKISNRIRQLMKFYALTQKTWPESYWDLAQFISIKRGSELINNKDKRSQSESFGNDDVTQFLIADQKILLPKDMLKKVDVMSRKFGLSVRSPFLDLSIVEFANSLPNEFKLSVKEGKRILRDAFRKNLPNSVFSRSKRGFEIPLYEWIKTAWSEIIEEKWFEERYLNKQKFFSFVGVKKMRVDFEKGKEEESTTVMWAYIVFQNWYRQWEER